MTKRISFTEGLTRNQLIELDACTRCNECLKWCPVQRVTGKKEISSPEKIRIYKGFIAIDNGVYGSTGNQPTLTTKGIDLEHIARAFGIRETVKVSDRDSIIKATYTHGLRFIHILALSGNRDVPNIPLHPLEIKKRFQEFLRV